MNKFDFLVLGGGIAGLTYALRAAEHGTVAILLKRGPNENSTSWAQGGVAAVTSPDDNFDLHIEDTLRAGAGLCHQDTVALVVKEGPARVMELISRGAKFDKSPETSEYHLHQEGGHSRRRIFHAADQTGSEIQRTMLAAARANSNITFFPDASAIDLITTRKLGIEKNRKNRALGAYIYLSPGRIEPFLAKNILVATGGAGKVYLYTSNPDVATGDGIAMCYRAGCRVANMEFFQFHPTCLYHPQAKSFLITEAMRGEGAKLKRVNGEEFMHKYDEKRELAPRDIVARAIDNEMKLHGEDYVLLDITHRDPEFVKAHFPMIYKRCLSFGFDITKAPIPVVPAAHYCCGGVVADEHGKTDIEHLYVAGECAHTGLHGANRLASNSLLEGLVFGYRAAEHSIQGIGEKTLDFTVPAWNPGSARNSDEDVVITQNWDEIRRFMWNYVGIVRSSKRLERALHRYRLIEHEISEYYWNFTITPDLLELRNINLVASLVIRCAMERKESRGLHYTIDFPHTSEKFLRDTVLAPPHPAELAAGALNGM
jgi:L-aspartate oxidase